MPVIFSMYRRNRPRTALPCRPYSCCDQHSLHPAIDLLPILALKPDFLARLNEPANRFQTQLLCFVHADVQSPACLILQAHLVLESNPSFRLILYWKRVLLARDLCYS